MGIMEESVGDFIRVENQTSDVLLKDELLGEISDEELGIAVSPERAKNKSRRYCVRCILTNEKGEVCVIRSEKYGYQQIPGGRVDAGEHILAALERETHEEAGCMIKNVKSLGYFIEHKNAAQNEWETEWVSFVFTAEVDQEIGTQFEDYEREAGFAPVWLELAEAMRLQAEAEKSYGDGTSNGSYNGRFANRRDYLLLRKYTEIKQK